MLLGGCSGAARGFSGLLGDCSGAARGLLRELLGAAARPSSVQGPGRTIGDMDATALRTHGRPIAIRWTLVAALLLLAVTAYGGIRAVSLLRTAGEDPTALRLGDVTYQVVSAEEVVGIANSDLMGGMGHNISGLVSQDQMMVQVWLHLSSSSKNAAYDPAGLRAFLPGSTKPILPASGTLASGVLTPHATVEGSIGFVVPRGTTHLLLGAVGVRHTIDIPALPAGAPYVPNPNSSEHHH